jgi:hypothetical protein
MSRFLSAAILVASCTAAIALEQAMPEPLGLNVVGLIHEAVRERLKDPESARFGTLIGGRDRKGVFSACGWVNAKNSLGGYTGIIPFAGIMIEVSSKPAFHVVSMGDGGDGSEAVLALCKALGLPLR